MAKNKKIEGKDIEAWCEESHKYFQDGDFSKALEAAEKALAIDSQSPLALTRRGNAKGGTGDYDAATEDHTAAINIDPTFERAYHNRGSAKYYLGDFEGAITDYVELIRLNPKDSDAYSNRGLAKHELGDTEGAIADYDEAIRLNPDNSRTYNNRGVVKHELGDTEGAIADYEEAIRLKGDGTANAYFNRANVNYNKGAYEEARDDYENFLKLADGSEFLLQREFAETRIKELLGQNKKKEKSSEEPPKKFSLETKELAVIIVDIVGSTKMLADNGVDDFLEHVLYKLLAKGKFVAKSNGARVIKHTGDGLMMVADTVDAALNASIELVEFAQNEKFDTRIGIDYGKVKVDTTNQLAEGLEDVFGEPVIAAVRLEGISIENGNLFDKGKNDERIDDLPSAVTEGRNRILMTSSTKEEASLKFRNNCCYVGHYRLTGLKHRRPIYSFNWKDILKLRGES